MTVECAQVLGASFERGCADIAHAIAAVAIALRPSMDTAVCTHPDELRDHAGATMGHPRWTCTGCGFSYDAKAGS